MTEGSGVLVTGGPDGIAARTEDLLALAAVLQTTAVGIGDALADLTCPALELALAAGAAADPGGVAAIRAGLGGLVGSLRTAGEDIAAVILGLQCAAASYHEVEHDVGRSFLAQLADAVWGAAWVVPPAAVAAAAHLPERDLSPLFVLPRLLAPLLPDGSPVLHDLGADPSTTLPPHRLSDLVLDLAARDRGRPGEISVSFVVGADGRRRAIVDIPGTKSWNPAPVADVTSVGTDIIAIAGRSTAYENGVFAALADAGVTPDTEVMLVGHSEGGIVAVDAATDAAATGRFRITHVVTAGSPVGAIAQRLPANVQLLSLENDADVVPALDATPNPDRPNVTTVQVSEQHGSIGANHGLDESYEPAAVAAQTAGSGSVEAFVAGAHGFLDSDTMATHAYQITRSP